MRKILLRTVLVTLLVASVWMSGCVRTRVRTVLVPPGEPVQLRAPTTAKVWVLDKDGTRVPGEVTLPEGWWCLPDPGP
jgi:hypothetical protein